nr:FAD/NAD(P)-binding protein [Brachybacterium muris]
MSHRPPRSPHVATPPGPTGSYDAVIVGGGPRGVATVLRTLARLRAAAGTSEAGGNPTAPVPDPSSGRPAPPSAGPSAKRPAPPLRLAMVDALAVGPGATWLIDQPAAYLNNTQARATTIHPDHSTRMSGPAAPGPDLVAWARSVAQRGHHRVGDWVVQEATALGPDSFPTRRLQGVYFRDQLDAANASGELQVEKIVDTAVDLEHEGEHRVVVLAGGRRLSAPTVVLAQGMVQAVPGTEESALAAAAHRHGLRYVPPGMPAERCFTGLPAGQDVLVRGLGANFFDVIGQLVEDWGGRVEAIPADPTGRLRYLPSGREPRLVAGSRRCVPYRSKPDGGRPTRGFTPRWATPEWFAGLATERGVDFGQRVWPQIAREFARVYLEALEQYMPAAVAEGWPAALDAVGTDDAGQPGGAAPPGGAGHPRGAAPPGGAAVTEAVDAVLSWAITDPRWSWTVGELHRPTAGRTVTAEQWQAQVARLVEDELGSMSDPDRHPRAAVNAAMAALRVQVERLAASGALSGQSLARDVLGRFDADGLALASGPPAHRARLMLALIEAGVIDLLGPGFHVAVDEEHECFVTTSPITGRQARARVLLETRMSKGQVPATSDPLLQALLSTGRARIHSVDGIPTHSMEATAAEVDESVLVGHNLVAADGSIDRGVVVLGIPAGSTQPGSAIGASPGVPSPLLAGADVAAKQILARVGGPAHEPVAVHSSARPGSFA